LSNNEKPVISTREFFDRWNTFAGKKHLAVARRLTDKRKAKIKTRLHDDGWLEDFLEACERLPIAGDGWQPDLDWVIENDTNVSKILEGKYDWRAGGTAAPQNKMPDDYEGL